MDVTISHIEIDKSISDESNSTNAVHDLFLDLKVTMKVDNDIIRYIAANPPDYITSYSGSGLPFANFDQAFENTNNFGSVVLDKDGRGTISMRFPNAYYDELGNKLVTPYVAIFYHVNKVEKSVYVNVSDGLPYRSLTHPKSRNSPTFYSHGWHLPVSSQETILRNSAYPSTNQHHENFWGMRPPK